MSPLVWFLLSALIYEREALRLSVQRLSIYSENCCKGKSEHYEANARKLEDVSMIVSRGHMKSFSIHHGLWSLSLGVNYTKGGIYYEGNGDDLHGNCGSSASAGGGDYIQYKSIRYVGNAILDLPGLSFFTGDDFQGEELYFDGTNLRLPSPYVFKSYGFTGRDNWTVFPLTNFTGGSSCLIAQNKVVSFIHKGTTVTVGSLQRGCTRRGKEKNGKKPTPLRSKTLHTHEALILYSETNQIGERLYTDAFELRLPLALHFKSHSFIGIKNWTIFAGTDLGGHSACLYNPKSSSGRSKPTALINMAVGSVRRGCDTDVVKELITPPPETQDQQVDTSKVEQRIRCNCLGLVATTIVMLLFCF